MTDETTSRRHRFGFLALFLTLALGIIVGGIATVAFAHGSGMGGMHRWGGHHRMHEPMNAERAHKHVSRMVGHLASSVDAAPDQKQKLTAIADTIAREMPAVHEKMRAAHKKAHDLLLQPQTDRVALEALRVEQIALADEVSKKLVQALADAADVLTPEQRAKLAQRWDN